MKKFALLVMTAAVVCSCDFSSLLNRIIRGDGTATEVSYELGAFAGIASVGSVDVIYTPSSGPQSVVLTCDENLVDYYDIVIERGILTISTKKGYIVRPKIETFVTVTAPPIYGVSITGSGDCVVKGDLPLQDDAKFLSTGSSDLVMTGTVTCKNIEVKTTGSGDIQLDGVIAEEATFSSFGSGDLAAGRLSAETISMSFAGSGDGAFRCEDAGDITVRISGSGDVTLSGNARTLQSKVSGSGRVDSYYLALSGGR